MQRTGIIYTGYALSTPEGYMVVTLDPFSRGHCYYPCSNQASPFMMFDEEPAQRAVDWLNTHFNLGAIVKPLRYCDGEWIDMP